MITDYKKTEAPKIEEDCEAIIELLKAPLVVAKSNLHQVRNIVRGQKAVIVAELGVDNAKTFLAIYNKLGEAIKLMDEKAIKVLPEE